MDFKHIVETYEAYNEKNLNEKDKEFIAGMRFVLDNAVENFLANYFIGEPDTTVEKMKYEIVSDAIEELKQYIDGDIYEAIVSLIDNYGDDEE